MSAAGRRRLEVLADAAALATHVAGWMAEKAAASADFVVALSGGTTPRLLYETLAGEPFGHEIDWARTFWFWGDERFVPADDPANNARTAREALLSRVPVPENRISPIPTAVADVNAAAAAYERTLRDFAARNSAHAQLLFDVTLLGLGEDGHTASLFPASAALAEREHWVAGARGPAGDARVTLTIPTLERSRSVAFLVTGAGKRAVLQRLLRGDPSLPAAHLNPLGDLTIFCDAAAAG